MGTRSFARKQGHKIVDSHFTSASSNDGHVVELDLHDLLNASINGSSFVSDIWPHFGQRNCLNGKGKSLNGHEDSSNGSKESSEDPEKSFSELKKGFHGPKISSDALGKSPDASEKSSDSPRESLDGPEKSLDHPGKILNGSSEPGKSSDVSVKSLDYPGKGPDGTNDHQKSSIMPEKPLDGLEKSSMLDLQRLCSNHNEIMLKVKLENFTHKTSSSSDEVVGQMNYNDEQMAKNGNIKSEIIHIDTNLYENQCLWKPWSQREIYTLVSAVEECCLLYHVWDLDNNTKWDIILKHIKKNGYVFRRPEKTARVKLYQLIRGFKDIKRWKSQKKSPSYDTMTFKQRMASGLPRCFSNELYTRMQAFFNATGIDDGMPGGSKIGNEVQISGSQGGRITRAQQAAINASKDGEFGNGIMNPSNSCSEQHGDNSGDFDENNEGYVDNLKKSKDVDNLKKSKDGDSGKKKVDKDVNHKEIDNICNKYRDVNHNKSNDNDKDRICHGKGSEEEIFIMRTNHENKKVISKQRMHDEMHVLLDVETVSLEETHTISTQSFHEEKMVRSRNETDASAQSVHEEEMVGPQETRVSAKPDGSLPNIPQRSLGVVEMKKRKHVPDSYVCEGSSPQNFQQTNGIPTEKRFANKKNLRTRDKQAGSSPVCGSQQTNTTPRPQRKATNGSQQCRVDTLCRFSQDHLDCLESLVFKCYTFM